jgi:NADH dehydrogenase FAD-containing subunit
MKKNVVIIGGGFAGCEAAGRLQEDFHVTLIDRKEFFECTVGVPKALFEPEYLDTMTIPYSKLLKKTDIVIAKVLEVSPQQVTHSEGILSYDYLLICSGSGYNFPIKTEELAFSERAKKIKALEKELREAEKVLVVGGGPVGVEVAGEIATIYPDKELTLVHNDSHLVPRLSKKSQDYAEDFFRRHRVRLILGESVRERKNNTYITDKGTTIEADIKYNCIGIVPNTDFLTTYFSENIDEKKRIKVNDYLQVPGYQNIFALGDCNNVNEEKLAINAKRHATLTVDNMYNLEKGHRLQPYIVSKLFISLVSLGSDAGLLSTPWYTMIGFMPAQFKKLEVPMFMKTLTFSYPQLMWELYS